MEPTNVWLIKWKIVSKTAVYIYIYPKEIVGFWLQRPTPQLLVEKKESKRGEE